MIQLILLASIALVTVLLGRSTSSARHMAYRRLFLVLFVVGSAAAILFPTALTRLANVLGVGRGSDLLLYILVIAFIGSLAMASRRATELGRKLTAVTRALALQEARYDELAARLDAVEARQGDDTPV
ncbi:conserved hypothetical protein [Xylanimonas cellulosilytica DSM 15894]|uniref:DUF2304 domain-containing protein n=1 Tax=Xylanimonas cellulosilytica (strain DSM 15894 / JCM 12276 / CECT 5975 / KCTC 9989 / LMG 20990 / NBRC 107835 / XIL07) TaxID=446471 RepID=D1BX39_XYLCX|nr:DUF2304 domain-containing protein [Xylanimonas cellulosilytica]ACZ31607.1 conserved hypothetical protein [Xylanimonas cellulosilytica DSM 15894]